MNLSIQFIKNLPSVGFIKKNDPDSLYEVEVILFDQDYYKKISNSTSNSTSVLFKHYLNTGIKKNYKPNDLDLTVEQINSILFFNWTSDGQESLYQTTNNNWKSTISIEKHPKFFLEMIMIQMMYYY